MKRKIIKKKNVINEYTSDTGFSEEWLLSTKMKKDASIKWWEISPCFKCHCMTHTANGKCGKCGGKK